MISPGSSFKICRRRDFSCAFYELVSGKRTGEGQCDTGSGCADLNTAVKAEGITHCFDELLQLLRIQTPKLPRLRCQMSIPDKLAECNLLCLGSSLVIVCRFLAIDIGERRRKHHKADSNGGQQKPGKGTDVDNILPACETEQRRGRFLQVDKLIFKIILNDQAVML